MLGNPIWGVQLISDFLVNVVPKRFWMNKKKEDKEQKK